MPASMSRRGVLALGAATTALTGLAPREGRAAEGGTIRISFASPIATLDPTKQRVGGMEYNYVLYCFNHLTRQDAQLQVIPDLATSWESSADLKTWTFHLRDDVKFHDGKPFTAVDVVFTINRIKDKAVASVLRANFDVVSAVEAVDPHTVRFTLASPYADMPALTAGYQAAIIGAHVVDTITTQPIGTGPFKFVSYTPGDQMVLEKNPSYFLAGVPKIDRAVLRVIPEYTTAVAALESGGIDIAYNLPAEQIDRLKRSTVSTVMEVATGSWQGIIMHNEMKPFDDPRVRRAILKLVDRQEMTDIATLGHGTSTITPLPPTHPYFRKDISLASDIPGAKKLLAEAGLANGFALEMYVPSGEPSLERLATAFRDVAKQVNITISLRVTPADKFYAEMEGKVPFNVDNFFGRATPDLMLYPWYHSTGSWNNTLWHYKNPEVDKLLEAARVTTDQAEQKKLYGRFQEIIAEDGPGSVVFVSDFACGVSKKVAGFAPSPLMLMDISTATIAA